MKTAIEVTPSTFPEFIEGKRYEISVYNQTASVTCVIERNDIAGELQLYHATCVINEQEFTEEFLFHPDLGTVADFVAGSIIHVLATGKYQLVPTSDF